MVLVSYTPESSTSILQTKFRHRERHEARRVRPETMPLDQHIESGHRERQARLKIGPAPMHHLLEMTHEREHRQHRLYQHPVLPFAALTQFEVGGIPLRGMEAGVAQDNHPSVNVSNEPLKSVIGDIGGVTGPPHDQAVLVQQQAEFAADNPAMIGEAFAANLLGTAAFTHGMDQLDPIGINDAEHGRGGQERPRPILMGREETKEPGALGEAGEQRPIVARQPAIKGPVAPAFEGMEQPQGDDLTGPEVGLGVFGDGAELLVDLVEQCRDKLDGDHGLLRAWQGVTLATSMEEVHDQDNKASRYY